MTLEICSESVWERLCQEDATCTFFQTPAWHRIAARHYAAESVPLLFRFENTEACLPLLKKRRWGRDVYFSPFGTYTALVCPQQLGVEDLNTVALKLKQLNIHLVSSPFTPNVVTVGNRIDSKTQIIELKTLNPENLMRDWEPDQRRRALLSQKNGIVVREAGSPNDWKKYYALYQHSLKRWGKNARGAYPDTLFETIRESLSGNSAMRICVAENKGEMVAGAVIFFHNRHAVLWHSASEKHGTTQLLFFSIMQDALQRGFVWFDLGGSGGLAGVETFKKQFGTTTLSFESSLNRTGIVGFLAKLRDQIKR